MNQEQAPTMSHTTVTNEHLQTQIVAIDGAQKATAANLDQLATDLRTLSATTNKAIQDTNLSIANLGDTLHTKINNSQATLLSAIERKEERSSATEKENRRQIWPILFGAIGVAGGLLTVYIGASVGPLAVRLESVPSAERVAKLEQWKEDMEKWVLVPKAPGTVGSHP